MIRARTLAYRQTAIIDPADAPKGQIAPPSPVAQTNQVLRETRTEGERFAKEMLDDLRGSEVDGNDHDVVLIPTTAAPPGPGFVDIPHGLGRILRGYKIISQEDASTVTGHIRRVTSGIDATTTLRLEAVGFDAALSLRVRVW